MRPGFQSVAFGLPTCVRPVSTRLPAPWSRNEDIPERPHRTLARHIVDHLSANGKEPHFSWVTDLPIDATRVMALMRGARVR